MTTGTTLSSSIGVSQRTNVYAERKMLEHAEPVIVLGKMAERKTLPKNKSQTLSMRRPRPFSPITTPTAEGQTPTPRRIVFDDINVQIKQYSDLHETTDVIEDTHEDPVLNEMTMLAGENIGRSMEQLNYGVLKACTNKFFAGSVAARNNVVSALNINDQHRVVRALRDQKARPITSVLTGSPNFQTKPIEAAYVAVTHTDLEADIRDLPGFTPCSEYGTKSMICPEEIGSVNSVRYVISPDLEPYMGLGGATTAMLNTSGNANVYPVMFFGRNAWATVALGGKDSQSVSPTIIPVNQRDKSDPLGQRGYVGWKTWHAAVILNDLWMAVLEVAATSRA